MDASNHKTGRGFLRVATARTPQQADQWQERLVIEGIPYTITNRSALRTLAVIPFVPFALDFLVPESDADRARSALRGAAFEPVREAVTEARIISWALLLLIMVPLPLTMIAGLIITIWP